MKRPVRAAAMVAAAFVLAGCARVPLGAPAANMEALVAARASGIAPLGVGEFRLAAGRPASLDQSVGARGHVFLPPVGGSFARYLGDTLAAQLRGAGLLDPAAAVAIEGELTDSGLDVPAGAARASLAARFVVRHEGRTLYARELRAEDRWQAPFNGFEAVPDALNRYTALYRRLVTQLLADPEFRAALRGVTRSTGAHPGTRTAAGTS